jgi:tetratricopeptide (TPR) repeat protein
MTEEIEVIKQQAMKDYNKKNFESAIQGFQTCLTYFKSIDDELSAAEAHNNLSVTYLGMKSAQLAYEEALGTDEIFARNGDRKRQGMAVANTAAALEALDRKEEALALYERSLDIFKEIGEKEMRASILRRIADLQIKTKRGFQAIASMEAAYDQEEKRPLKDSLFKSILTSIRQKLVK